LRKGRPENGESWHTEQCREMAGAGVIADEAVGAGEDGQQHLQVAERIIKQGHVPAGRAQPAGDSLEPFARPPTRRLARAGVDHHAPAVGFSPGLRHGQAPAERMGQTGPVLRAMRTRGARQRLRKQQVRTGAGKTESSPRPGQGEQRVVARIQPRGDAEIKTAPAQFAPHAGKFAPWPAMQAVFVPEGRPRRGERHEFDPRREAGQQRRRMRLGQERHARLRRRDAQERHGEGEVAQAPEFQDEEARRSGGLRRFCQAAGVKFSIPVMTSSPQPGVALPPHARAGWLPALACALAGAAVFQFFGNSTRGYIDTASLFYWWGFQWVNPSSETQHGWLILGLSAWLFWRNLHPNKGRDVEGSIGEPPTNPGFSSLRLLDSSAPALAAMLGALALHAAGYAVQQARVSIAALLLFTWGVLRLAGGRQWGRAAAFPLAFLLFAVPVNFLDTVGFYLRLWVSEASAALAHAAGIGVVRNGTQLFASDGRYNYDVAAACSGVRSLMAMLALSLLAGYLNLRAWWRRGAVLALALPAVLIGNIARIAAIIFAAQIGGQAWGNRAHAVMDYGIFAVVLCLVLAAVALLRRFDRGKTASCPPVDPTPDSSGARCAAWIAAIVVVAAAAGVAGAARRLDALPPAESVGLRLAADGVNPAELPSFLGTKWMGEGTPVTPVERTILPPDTGFSRKLYVRLDDRRRQVFVSLVLSGRDRTSIHRPELCLIGQGWTILGSERRELVAGGRAWPVTLLRVETQAALPGGGSRRVPALAVYWFIGGGSAAATTGGRMWREACDRLLHARRNRWAYVFAQTTADDGEAAALARMQTVLAQALPPVLPAP